MCGIIIAAKNVVPFCTTFMLLSVPPFHIHTENILFKLNEIIFWVKILLLLVSVLLTYSVVQKSLPLFLLYRVKLNVHTQYIILPRRTQLDYTFQSTVHSTQQQRQCQQQHLVLTMHRAPTAAVEWMLAPSRSILTYLLRLVENIIVMTNQVRDSVLTSVIPSFFYVIGC